jgi:hypothetical protein
MESWAAQAGPHDPQFHAQSAEDSANGRVGQRLADIRYEEMIALATRRETFADVSVVSQLSDRCGMQRDQAGLAELGLANSQNPAIQIGVGFFEV